MKNTILFLFIILLSVSCSKKENVLVENTSESQVLPYDTTAIDSFAPGATPNNVIMNRVIVDSATLAKMEEQKLIAKKKKEEDDKAKTKLAEETKKKEDEKKKAEEAAKKKKAEEKPKPETNTPQVTETPQQ